MQAEHVPLYVHGHGAVSCAGMDAHSLYQACKERKQIPAETLDRETGSRTISYAHRPLDTKALRAVMPKHPRLRRASNVTKFAVTAAHQAIGEERLAKMKNGELRIGIVMSFMNGCVNYSNRFFSEVLDNPSLASPMIFPETVFNAPASHVAAYLECDGPVYTLIGDTATWFSAMRVAEDWIAADLVDGCLVVSAEETDWLTLEALNLYSRDFTATEGAAAVYLEATPSGVALDVLIGPFDYTSAAERRTAMASAFSETPSGGLFIDGLTGIPRMDKDEAAATSNWNGDRMSPAKTLGEGMGIRYGFQTIAALEALQDGNESVTVFATGGNQHAFSARFTKNNP